MDRIQANPLPRNDYLGAPDQPIMAIKALISQPRYSYKAKPKKYGQKMILRPCSGADDAS